MPRIRRSGISYVEDADKRKTTFFNRSYGLFKTVADLSTLTGAAATVVIESNNGKVSAFGTPSVDSMINSFLLGSSPMYLFVNEKKANIASLQNKLFMLKTHKAVNDKRHKESITCAKPFQERSSMGKLICGNIEDLGVDEVCELLHGLSLVLQEIEDRSVAMQPSHQLEMVGHAEPLVPRQSSLLLPGSSRSQPLSLRPQSSLMNPTILPSPPQAPEIPYLQHIQMLQHNSMNQAQLMPQPNESHLHNYHIWDNAKISQPFLQSHVQSSLEIPSSIEFFPQPPALQILSPQEANLSLEGQNFNLAEPSQHQENTHSIMNNDDLSYFFGGIDGNIFSPDHTITNDQLPSVTTSNEPYYDSLHGLDVQMGYLEDIGGHATNNVSGSSNGF
ncbi:hypothetical protein ACP4OV_027167 [Aristida adscensionis]